MQLMHNDSVNLSSGSSKSKVITVVERFDVLMGRGATIDNNPGNVIFRNLVRNEKEVYMSTARHQKKQEIAEKIKVAVTLNGGRFLRKIESVTEMTEMDVPVGVVAWTFADYRSIFLKIKQALRDKGKNAKETGRSLLRSDSITSGNSGQDTSLRISATTPCDYGASVQSTATSFDFSDLNQRLVSQIPNLRLSSFPPLQEPITEASSSSKAKLLIELASRSIINNHIYHRSAGITLRNLQDHMNFASSGIDAVHFNDELPLRIEAIKRNCFPQSNEEIPRCYLSDAIVTRMALEALLLQLPMK